MSQITTVRCQRDVSITEQIGHTLSHIDPLHDFPAVARDLLENFKSFRFVDDHLQPEDRACLVVHFEPVLFYSMFDPGSGNALEREIAHVADNFAFEVGADLSSKKAHDLLGAKTQCAVTQ